MIDHRELQEFAVELIDWEVPTEAQRRRAISALYYGLFHHLTDAAASVFDDGTTGGRALAAQATRAFSHTAMRKLCDVYARSPKQKMPAPLSRLQVAPPDQRLVSIAEIFGRLQEAREIADYDLHATVSQADAELLVTQAETAHQQLDDIMGLPETRVFLTALLLADRWARRG